MRAAAIALLTLCLPAAAAAANIRTYDVRLLVQADRAAQAVVSVALDGARPGAVEIPLGFVDVRDLRVTDVPAGATWVPLPVNAQTTVRLELPEGVPDRVSVGFRFGLASAFQVVTPGPGERSTLPAGSRLFRHALINTGSLEIDAYRVEVAFPTDSRAHAIREWAPKLRKGEAGPRVRLAEIDGRPGARLLVGRLRQGDSASMLIEVVPRSRSYGWLIAGLVVSLLYLVYFRDLVRSRP